MKKIFCTLLLGIILLCSFGCVSRHVCENCGENKKCDNIAFMRNGNSDVTKCWICSNKCRMEYMHKNHFNGSSKGLVE